MAFGYIKFEVHFRQSGGDINVAILYMSSESKGEIWAGIIFGIHLNINYIKRNDPG